MWVARIGRGRPRAAGRGGTVIGEMLASTAGTVYLIVGILLGLGLLAYAIWFIVKLGK